MSAPREKGRQGFASMPRERVQEIASLGGLAAHEKGVAHQWKAGAEASAAGKRGGHASQQARRRRRLATQVS